MEDLKKYVLVDSSKLKKSLEEGKLKYLSFISDNIEYWEDLFTYDEEKSELEKFLLYRTAGAFDIHGYIDDGDIAPPVFDYLTNKLKTIKNVKQIECKSNLEKKEYYSSKRVVIVFLDDGTKLYLETDTANSLMYDLGDFFREVLVKRFGRTWYQNYIKSFQLPEDKEDRWYKPFKFYYFYTLVSDSFNGLELSDEEIECLKALEERAKYTHTLKNMILPNSLTKIGAYAFCDCENLTSVTIPVSTTEIGPLAFRQRFVGNVPYLTIHAPAGSCAEQYAKEHNIPFQPIEE